MPELPPSVTEALRTHVGAIRRVEAIGGGCIANATRLDTDQGRFFLKWSGGDAGHTFEAEAAGLRALRAADSPLLVPEVVAAENADPLRPGYLLMGWVESGSASGRFWASFGEGLARLHRHTAPDGGYGFDIDNFIGRIEQVNHPFGHNGTQKTWPAFFRHNRLGAQIGRAREMGRWRSEWNAPADQLLDRLDDLLPAEPPASVLHGDLWSGNFLATADGRAALIDPATYYGHRETDLALTELFGGFDARFYDAYRAAWPLEPGYDERREVYNLYHLINHLNHFGDGYAGGVERTLRRFG